MPYAIEADDLQKTFTGKHQVRALDGVSFNVEEGTVFGLLGPERLGQDHRGAHPDHHPEGRRRVGPGARPRRARRRPAWCGRLIGLAGQYAAVDENLTGRENLADGREAEPPASVLRHRSGHRAARPVRPRRRRRPPAQDLLGRHAPTARPGRRPGGPTHRALPRRAHHRPRPPEPQRPVGGHREPGRRRDHRAPHHPVPRGGRPAGQHLVGHRPRAGHRRGHPDRAEGRPGGDRPRGRAGHHRGRRRHRRSCSAPSAPTPRRVNGTVVEVTVDDGPRSAMAAPALARPGGDHPDRLHPAGAEPGRRVPGPDRPPDRGREPTDDRGRQRRKTARPSPTEADRGSHARRRPESIS